MLNEAIGWKTKTQQWWNYEIYGNKLRSVNIKFSIWIIQTQSYNVYRNLFGNIIFRLFTVRWA